MDARSYLTKVGLSVDVAAVREAQQALWAILEEAKKASLPATPSALNALYTYKVPKLSADGTCSLHAELDPTPYDLSKVLGGRSVQNSFSLLTLDALVESVAQQSAADWLGLYQRRDLAAGPTLVKLAYRGVESRPEFPLTEAFARTSNNAAVALDGKARVVQDVRAHVAGGGAYYECDPKVQAEVCLPLLDPNGKVIGVLDAESTKASHFTPERLALLVSLATEVTSHLPR
ncbi:MAG: GAF domain-containing protein [Archangium sp.]|nr:GAF domain-containing protein [Archangium sp.]